PDQYTARTATAALHDALPISTIMLGPGEPEMAHKTDEFCHLSKIEWAIEAYTEIARTWCGVLRAKLHTTFSQSPCTPRSPIRFSTSGKTHPSCAPSPARPDRA